MRNAIFFSEKYFITFLSITATSRTVIEQTKSDILCAVKWWMLTLKHNKHTTVHTHFIALHITTKFCPALLHTHFSPQKNKVIRPTPANTKLRQVSFLFCCAAEVWTPKTWILFTQMVCEKTYRWIFCYKVLNGKGIFKLPSLTLSVLFFPCMNQLLQFKRKKTWLNQNVYFGFT